MPQVVQLETPAGLRYHLDGQPLTNGDLIEVYRWDEWPIGRLALFNNPIGRLTWWWMTVGLPKGKLTVVPMSLRGEAIITDVAE